VWNVSANSSVEWEVPFGIVADGQWHVYYVPLFPFKLPTPSVQRNLTQMRLNPVKDALFGQVIKIDWIRVVRGELSLRVCVCAAVRVCVCACVRVCVCACMRLFELRLTSTDAPIACLCRVQPPQY
jgi:hypothetical protein